MSSQLPHDGRADNLDELLTRAPPAPEARRRGTDLRGGRRPDRLPEVAVNRMKLVIHPPVEPSRLDRDRGRRRADGGRQRRRRGRGPAPRCPTPTPSSARSRRALLAAARPAALGAVAHGQPGALPLPRAGRPPVRADQHARAVLRRDRRPGDGLRPLLRPQPARLHPQAAAQRMGAGRRRGGAGRLRRRAGRRSTPSTAPTATSPTRRWASSAWARSAREIARRALAFGMRVLAVDPRADGRAAGGRRGAVAGWSGCRELLGAERLRRHRRPAHAARRRGCSAGRSSGR